MAKKKQASQASDENAPAFEESLEKLEAVVHDLEDGRLSLSESLERYEQGIKYLKLCYRQLESAERKIELLTGVDKDGNAKTRPLDDEELSLESKAAARSQRRSQKPGEAIDDDDNVDTPGSLF